LITKNDITLPGAPQTTSTADSADVAVNTRWRKSRTSSRPRRAGKRSGWTT